MREREYTFTETYKKEQEARLATLIEEKLSLITNIYT